MNTSRMNFRMKGFMPGLLMAATLLVPVRHVRGQDATPVSVDGGQRSSPAAQSQETNQQEANENDEFRH